MTEFKIARDLKLSQGNALRRVRGGAAGEFGGGHGDFMSARRQAGGLRARDLGHALADAAEPEDPEHELVHLALVKRLEIDGV